jgi:asparagine synthetase B (glutamine-hydrolysing)
MPGLSGAITNRPGGLESQDSLASAFDKIHAVRGVDLLYRAFQSPNCVLHNTLTGLLKDFVDQPVRSPDRDAVLLLEGEVFNTDELRHKLRVPFGSSPGEILLALFLEQGVEMLSQLDGDFNLVILEERKGRLTLATDRFSCHPLFYLEDGDTLHFGSEKKSILAVLPSSPGLDPVGLLQVFAHQHNLSGRTWLRNLKRMPAASYLQYEHGRCRVAPYERIRFQVRQQVSKPAALIEEWCEVFTRDVASRIRGKDRLLIGLSGGLDSRAICCAIARDFRPVWTHTSGDPSSLEVSYAAKVAERLGMKHEAIDPSVTWDARFLPKIIWRTEGEVSFANSLSMPLHSRMREQGEFLAGGQFGDASSGGHIPPIALYPVGRARFLELAYERYMRYPEALLARVFNRSFLSSTLPDLKEAFLSSFEPFEGTNHGQLYEIWDLHERQARMTIGSRPTDSYLFEMVYGFLGRETMDFVLGLPTRLRFGQSLYQAMIRRLGPEVGDIPNANTDLCLSSTVGGNLVTQLRCLGRRARGKVLRNLSLVPREGSETYRVSMGGFTRQDPAFRDWLDGFLASDAFNPDVLNREGIEQLLGEHRSGAKDHSVLVCRLATLAGAFSYFLQKTHTSCPPEAEPLEHVVDAPRKVAPGR